METIGIGYGLLGNSYPLKQQACKGRNPYQTPNPDVLHSTPNRQKPPTESLNSRMMNVRPPPPQGSDLKNPAS